MGVLHWEGVGRVLGRRWEGVGGSRVVRVGSGSLIYRQIKWLHCSGYLLVYYIQISEKSMKLVLEKYQNTNSL